MYIARTLYQNRTPSRNRDRFVYARSSTIERGLESSISHTPWRCSTSTATRKVVDEFAGLQNPDFVRTGMP